MNADKNIDLNPEAQGPGFLTSLKKAVPGAKTVLAALSLATASRVAEAATATVEPLPEPLNSIVNDGVNHANALAENECGDVAFREITPDGSAATWHILNAGATESVAINGQYYQLNAAANCDFAGVDSDGAVWRLSSGNNWERGDSPAMTGIGAETFSSGDIAWNADSDTLTAYTATNPSTGRMMIRDASGGSLIEGDTPTSSVKNPDFDSNWHGADTALGRYFFVEQDASDAPMRVVYRSADDLSGDSTFVAEGIWPSLSPDETKVYFGQLNPSTGLYEVKQAVLPETATFYCDSDGDGHGDIAHPFVADFDSIPAGGTFFEYQGVRYVASSDDCDDNWAAHILPTDCNPETEDTDTPEDTVDTEDTPDDPVDTPDDTNDTEDTPSSHGNAPDIDVRRATGCDTTGNSTGWAIGAAALALARSRRRGSEGETDAERRP